MSDPIIDIFREEAKEHLGALEKSFLDLEAAGTVEARRELVDQLFRHAHSLKSDAKVVGLTELKQASQLLEDLLDELRESPERIDAGAVSRGLKHFDQVRMAYDSWQWAESQPAETAEIGLSVESAESEALESAAERQVPESGPLPMLRSPSRPLAAGMHPDPLEQLPHPPAMTPPGASRTAITPPAAAHPTPFAKLPSEESFTVRVPSDRLDRMLNVAGELRICQRSRSAISARIAQLRQQLTVLRKQAPVTSGAEGSSLHVSHRQLVDSALDQLQRIAGELRTKGTREERLVEFLESDIRDARLLPLAMLTDSMRRAVRGNLAQSLGKSIHYQAAVGKILLDKAVIESLKDPLVHLIRNAADHGIELPDDRRAAGKTAEGMIRIVASQHGPQVRLIVSDDGRGLNFVRVRERIRETTELEEAAVKALSESELTSYLFQPGFSTAPAGEVSGRGVGLDVVRDAIQRLHGSVQVQSSSPAGTTFVISVPVTVSMVRILTVASGGTTYGVPTAAIKRIGRARRRDLHELEGALVLPVDGQPVRWVQLADLVGESVSQVPHADMAWSYLLVAHENDSMAVAVDELQDETEVLLKPLGFPLHNRPDLLGATLRADGSVQLVLDLANPIWTSMDRPATQSVSSPAAAGKILIVDDSPTTRAVLRNVFTAAGYSVVTATDGIDAMECLRGKTVDLVISDVEMPRLNGFDLARQVKARYGLPVILVTGREKEEHRREGLAAGADAYVVKSTFQDRGLLEIVQQFL